MINILRSISSEIGPGVRRFLDESFDTEWMHGLHIRFDPYWLAYHRWRISSREYLYGDLSRHWMDYPSFLRPTVGWSALKDRPSRWVEHCRQIGYPEEAQPILFVVILRDEVEQRERREFPNTYNGYPIRYERRPPARGLSFTGTAKYYSLGKQSPNTNGTAGGLIGHSGTGEEFVVSCAHVIGSKGDGVYLPGPASKSKWLPSSNPRRIGTVVLDHLPPQSQPRTCNKSNPLPLNTLDLAVAKLDTGSSASAFFPHLLRPQHVTLDSEMITRDPIFFLGNSSGYVDAEFGSYVNWHLIEIDGVDRCFSDIFSITPPHPWYFNTELARSGDSGAWIYRYEAGLLSWDGMLFAGDGSYGYACFSQNISEAWSKHNSALALLP